MSGRFHIADTDEDWDDEDPSEIPPLAVHHARHFLSNAVGMNVNWFSDGLAKTPERFTKMIRELTTPEDFEFTVFPNDLNKSDLIVIRDIDFVALCSHHIVPFIGKAHIGYIPQTKIAGLSKFARAVRFWAAGLWAQEDLTNAIAIYLIENLDPMGLGVVMEAEHLCMTIRGVQAPGTKTVTSTMKGVFLDPLPGRTPKQEFLDLLKIGR